MVGFPEAQIILAEAVLYISLAPKSNSTVVGISAAMTDIAKKSNWSIPRHLKDAHYNGANRLGYGIAYKYPHAYGDGLNSSICLMNFVLLCITALY